MYLDAFPEVTSSPGLAALAFPCPRPLSAAFVLSQRCAETTCLESRVLDFVSLELPIYDSHYYLAL
jgi:hypothetical protein